MIDQQTLISAQRKQQLAADKVAQLSEMLQSMSRIQQDSEWLFRRFWMRPTREDIQEYADSFTIGELQTQFACHKATMELLAAFFPDFRPQIPPYEFEWTETRLIIGEKKPDAP